MHDVGMAELLRVMRSEKIRQRYQDNLFLNRWGPVIVWMGFITLASSISNPFVVVPEDVQISNEIIGRISHVLEFVMLGFLVNRAFYTPRISRAKLLSMSLVTCLAFAVFDEFHQYFVPERAFELLDLGLDGVGIVLGVSLFLLLARVKLSSVRAN